MPKVAEHTQEFKDRDVRFVAAERAPDESRSAACERLAPKIGVKPVTFYGWVKKDLPKPTAPVSARLVGGVAGPGRGVAERES